MAIALSERKIEEKERLTIPLDTASPTDIGNLSPFISPTSASNTNDINWWNETERGELIISELRKVSDIEDLEDETSAQYKASRWIINLDLRQLSAEDANLIQKYALFVFFYSTGGKQDWKEQWDWSKTECKWYGVTCNENGSVILINLHDYGLSGSIPSELQLLTNLEELRLHSNALRGNLPN